MILYHLVSLLTYLIFLALQSLPSQAVFKAETFAEAGQWIPMVITVVTLSCRVPLPGRDLDHLTIHSNCFSHSLLRLLSRRWGTSGWELSKPEYTTSGSMFSSILMICWESCTSWMPGMQDMEVKAWLSLDMAKWDWNIRDGAKPKAFRAPKRFSFLPVKLIQGQVRFDNKEHNVCPQNIPNLQYEW